MAHLLKKTQPLPASLAASLRALSDTLCAAALLFAALLPTVFFTACGEVDLGEEETTAAASGTDTAGGTDTSAAQGDTLSVAGLRAAGATGEDTWVAGYIVGYVAGTAISAARFTAPAEGVQNTNLLIADTPGETATAACAAVQLPASSVLREELCLSATPSLIGRRFAFYGTAKLYFKQPGIYPLKAFGEVREKLADVPLPSVSSAPAEVFEGD